MKKHDYVFDTIYKEVVQIIEEYHKKRTNWINVKRLYGFHKGKTFTDNYFEFRYSPILDYIFKTYYVEKT